MKHQLILTALLATSALTTLAQDADPGAPHGRPGGPGHRHPPFVAALDVNKDGVIDATEIANAPGALAKLDKNGDGQITLDELRPPRPADAPAPQSATDGPKRPKPPIFAALDTDGDGVISATELTNASASLAKLDKNGDGKLTPDEFMGGGPRGPRGRGPGGPGGPGRGPRPNAPQE
jgi:hypothetical protein